jgi:hypothetical protein
VLEFDKKVEKFLLEYQHYYGCNDYILVWSFHYFYETDVSMAYLLYHAGKVYRTVESLDLFVERHRIIKMSRERHKQLDDYDAIYR